MNSEDFQHLSQHEFTKVVETALPRLFDLDAVAPNAVIQRDRLRADFVVQLKNRRPAIVEVAGLLPSTRSRLDQAVAQLKLLFDAYRDHVGLKVPQLALVTAGSLSHENVQYLRDHGIDYVFDGDDVGRALDASDKPLTDFLPQDAEVPLFKTLLDELNSIAPGRSEWAVSDDGP